jgi:predicted PolB exonuclease-like 3'-5' exonuclease
MPGSYLVMDIETVPDPALADPSAAPGFPPLHVHRPIVVGALWLDEDYRMKRFGVLGDGLDEKGMLQAFSSFVAKYGPDLVTYNGRGFDLPVLVLRSLRHGVPMSWYYQGRARHRYSEEGHLDLCDLLSDHGATRSLSLDAAARVIGLPGKVGVDGSQVEGLYKAGRLEEIKTYCLADVAQTALLFLRFRLLQGVMGQADYRRRAADLMAALRQDHRLAEVVGLVDDRRLLLAAA